MDVDVQADRRPPGTPVDAVVLGAGIVGVSTAVHLLDRGLSVAIVDRAAPGGQASYGNFGLVERSSLLPNAFPRKLRDILRYAANTSPDARYHLSHVVQILPWLASYWRHSSPARLHVAMTYAKPLIERSVVEHMALARRAAALDLIRTGGWMKVFRSGAALKAATADVSFLADHGLVATALDGPGIQAREPGLAPMFAGGIHYADPVSVSDPGGLTKAYARLFADRGGMVFEGDATSLARHGGHWTVATRGGTVRARTAVVALGAWSDDLSGLLGYRIPLMAKRGYHLNFDFAGDRPPLNAPVADVEGGYAATPMKGGVRICSGIEFARKNAPPTPVQLAQILPTAKATLPLGRQRDAEPWMGLRPCMPDMIPVIGAASNHPDLWFNFGHGHHGFTLGPATGRLLAEMMTGEMPFTDPQPYRPDRF